MSLPAFNQTSINQTTLLPRRRTYTVLWYRLPVFCHKVLWRRWIIALDLLQFLIRLRHVWLHPVVLNRPFIIGCRHLVTFSPMTFKVICLGVRGSFKVMYLGARRSFNVICPGARRSFKVICLGARRSFRQPHHSVLVAWWIPHVGLIRVTRPWTIFSQTTFVGSSVRVVEPLSRKVFQRPWTNAVQLLMRSSVVNIHWVITFSQTNCTPCVTFIVAYDLQITFRLQVTLILAEIRCRRSLGVKLGRTVVMPMNVTYDLQVIYNDLQTTYNDLQMTLRLKVTLVSRQGHHHSVTRCHHCAAAIVIPVVTCRPRQVH